MLPSGFWVATEKIEMNTPEGGAEALPEGLGCFHVAGLLVVVLDGPMALKLQQKNRNEYARGRR